MRVCFISHSAGRYGAELALLELLQGLVKLGVRCMVLVPQKRPHPGELDRMRYRMADNTLSEVDITIVIVTYCTNSN